MTATMQCYWMVHNTVGGAPNKTHATIESAIDEARRLASKHPGMVITILEAVTAFTVQQPAPAEINVVKP